MSGENTTATRSNFASRLLSKAMSERTKPGAKNAPMPEQETAKQVQATAAPVEVGAGKS